MNVLVPPFRLTAKSNLWIIYHISLTNIRMYVPSCRYISMKYALLLFHLDLLYFIRKDILDSLVFVIYSDLDTSICMPAYRT